MMQKIPCTLMNDRSKVDAGDATSCSCDVKRFSALRALIQNHVDWIRHLEQEKALGTARRAILKAARFVRMALERGGKIFLVLPEHSSGDETVRAWAKSWRTRPSVIPITSKSLGDECGGRAAFRRRSPRPEDLLVVVAFPNLTEYAVGIMKEANMWHIEPIVLTNAKFTREIRMLSEVRITDQALDLKTVDHDRVTTLIPFSPRTGRRKSTGTMDTP